GGRLTRLLPFDATATPRNLLARVNSTAVSAAPPKAVPPAIPTVDQAAGAARPTGVPTSILDLLAKYPWLPYAVLVLAALFALAVLLVCPRPAALVAALLAAAAGIALFALLQRGRSADAPAQAMMEANQTPSAVDGLPANPNFVLADPASSLRPAPGAG